MKRLLEERVYLEKYGQVYLPAFEANVEFVLRFMIDTEISGKFFLESVLVRVMVIWENIVTFTYLRLKQSKYWI